MSLSPDKTYLDKLPKDIVNYLSDLINEKVSLEVEDIEDNQLCITINISRFTSVYSLEYKFYREEIWELTQLTKEIREFINNKRNSVEFHDTVGTYHSYASKTIKIIRQTDGYKIINDRTSLTFDKSIGQQLCRALEAIIQIRDDIEVNKVKRPLKELIDRLKVDPYLGINTDIDELVVRLKEIVANLRYDERKAVLAFD